MLNAIRTGNNLSPIQRKPRHPIHTRLAVRRISDSEAQVLAHSAKRGDRGIDIARLDYDMPDHALSQILALLDNMVARGLLRASRDKHGVNQYFHTATGLRAERFHVISTDHMISAGLAQALGIRPMECGEQVWALVTVTQEALDNLIQWLD